MAQDSQNSQDSPSRLIAVASGKGGVGKTVCTANLALGTATRNRTLAVDLDIGCGNLNTCLGVRFPTRSIDDFISNRIASLSDVRLATQVERLQLISCSYRAPKFVALSQSQKEQILEGLRCVDFDYTFIDLGAGVHADVLDFFADADMKVLVTTPESVAMHNAFVFLKALIFRSLFRESEKGHFLQPIQKELTELLHSNGEMDVQEIVDHIRSWDRYSAYIVEGLIRELKVYVLVNMLTDEAERKYVTNFYNLVKKYLDLEVMLLGLVPYDPDLKESVREIVPFSAHYPHSPAAKAFRELSLKVEKVLSTN